MIASTILIAAVSTSVVVVLLSTIWSAGIGTRATESVLLRATNCLELTGHLWLIWLRHHHGWCTVQRHEGVSTVEASGVCAAELSRIVLLLRHSHAHLLLAPHHLLLKHRNICGVVHVWNPWHRHRHRHRHWLNRLLLLLWLLLVLIVFFLYHF